MKIVINNINMPLEHNSNMVIKAAREIVRSNCISAQNFSIYRQSIDARRKSNIHYVYSVSAETSDRVINTKDISVLNAVSDIEVKKKSINGRPIVIGMGPCGLFAAYVLALSGNPPVVLERGKEVDERERNIKKFWTTGVLDKNSNVQFGEGGAGTFSDGKLNTRISDPRQRFVLKTFTDFGAPEDILYKAKPHIGTDELKKVIKNMRNRLAELGCDIKFDSRVTDILIDNNKISGVEINGGEVIRCNDLIVAIGHSSRDTYEIINKRGIIMEPKPFAVGVRIEHSQRFIDRLQYGNIEGLPPADYRVVHNGRERSCYSFCMCPGGTVVNASSEDGMLTVNGMSEHLRNGENANSALVVNVKTSDFGKGVLGGIEFQRKYETLAYMLGGADNSAPVQLAEDFVNDVPSYQIKDVEPKVTSGYILAELKKCLPSFVSETLRDGLCDFERRIHGFSSGGAVLTGIEARTSAPVRILRNNTGQSINISGFYPAGEGAGYAGGIVSAAVDGIRIALSVLDNAIDKSAKKAYN